MGCALEVRLAAGELHGLDAEGVARVAFPVLLHLVRLKHVHLFKVALARDKRTSEDNVSPSAYSLNNFESVRVPLTSSLTFQFGGVATPFCCAIYVSCPDTSWSRGDTLEKWHVIRGQNPAALAYFLPGENQ